MPRASRPTSTTASSPSRSRSRRRPSRGASPSAVDRGAPAGPPPPAPVARPGRLSSRVRAGGPSDGEPVVLLHGFPQDSTAWDQVSPALHQQGLRTLAPDQRGYSPMARPRGRSSYRLRELADDVLAPL